MQNHVFVLLYQDVGRQCLFEAPRKAGVGWEEEKKVQMGFMTSKLLSMPYEPSLSSRTKTPLDFCVIQSWFTTLSHQRLHPFLALSSSLRNCVLFCRWDIQRIREQRMFQRLQQRMNKKKGIQESEPEVSSFYPDTEDGMTGHFICCLNMEPLFFTEP